MVTSLATTYVLPPEVFADDGNDFDAQFLLFDGKTGKYSARRDRDEIPIGTKVVPIVDEQLRGFTKFVDGKPQSHFLPLWPKPDLDALRQSLGDLDKGLWPRDSNGEAVDPWKPARKLPCFLLDETCEALVYSTSSLGGVRAVSRLGDAVRAQRRDPEHTSDLPIVSLEAESYLHKVKQNGRIFTPLFDIDGWTTHEAVREMLNTGNFAALLPAPSKRPEHRDEDAEQPAAPRRSSQMKEPVAPWDDDRSADAAREHLAQAKRRRRG